MSTAVGSPVSRKDGHLKVTGQARYAADHPMKNVAHAVAICSTVANGRVASIDSADAEKAPGFLAILHHGNAPKMYRPVNNFMSASKPGEAAAADAAETAHEAAAATSPAMAATQRTRVITGQASPTAALLCAAVVSNPTGTSHRSSAAAAARAASRSGKMSARATRPSRRA